MSIVKRTNKSGGAYYFNTTTKKFASEQAYKRAKSSPVSAYKARKGKPSNAFCSTSGRELVVKRTSRAGKNLRSCR